MTSAVIFFLFFAAITYAQGFTTTVSSNKIGKNQNAEVSYEVNGGASVQDFEAPQFRDWNVVSGPNTSSVQSISNGKMSSQTSISYVLQPKRIGRLMIEAARVVVDGKTLTSNTAMVEVLNKTVKDPQQSTNTVDPMAGFFDDPFGPPSQNRQEANLDNEFQMAQVLRAGENIDDKIRSNVMLKVITSKSSCYEGEPIVATYKIYTRIDLVNPDFLKRPSFSGFSSYDLDEGNQHYDIESVQGKNYRVYTYRKVQLYPLQHGMLTLDPVELDFGVKFLKYEAISGGSIDPNNSGNYVQKNFALKSDATNINVIPLPDEKKPADFKGAVGDFVISATTDGPEIGKDDASTLHIKISGAGNFSMVHVPAIPWPAGFEAYDPEEKENLVLRVVPISGDKTFDVVFISHKPGNFTIPPIRFSYFDLASKNYTTVETTPLTIKVLPESRQPKQLPGSEEANLPLIFTGIAKYVLPLLAGILIIYLVILFFGRWKKRQPQKEVEPDWGALPNKVSVVKPPIVPDKLIADGDIERANLEKYMPAFVSKMESDAAEVNTANPASLPHAEEALWVADHKVFYQALKNDILQAVAAAISQPLSSGRNSMISGMQAKGTDAGVIQQIGIILDECEAAIYAPVYDDANRRQTMEEARYLIARI